jgi:hypothetical protein
MQNPAKRKPKALVLPPGPHIVDGVIVAAGYQLVELMAANGATQAAIAARLGITHNDFKKRLALRDGNNELRLTWERGRGALEFEVASLLLTEARKGNVLALIYYSKSQLAWTDTPQIQTQVGLQIVLPAAMDRDSYMKSLTQLPEVKVIEHRTGGANE